MNTVQEMRTKINQEFVTNFWNRMKNPPLSKRVPDSVIWLFSSSGSESILRKAGRGGGGAGRAIPFTSVMTRPRRRGRCVVEIRQNLAFDGSTHDALQLADHVPVFIGHEGERVTCTLGATRASDAMDVGIGGIWHVEVDDVRDAFDIQTAGCNVCRNHDAEVSRLETVQGLFTLSLRAVAVQAGHAMACMGDLTCQFIGTMFGAGKDQH